jgi:phage repressor protein C with HTH and peptisase S24 domain
MKASVDKGYSLHARTVGTSMWPLFMPGQTVLITPAASEPLPGDIIVYTNRYRLVGHRIKGFNFDSGNKRIIAQGDACSRPDEPVDRIQVIGQINVL